LNKLKTQSAYMQPPKAVFVKIGKYSSSRGEAQKIQNCKKKKKRCRPRCPYKQPRMRY
jgi:hypothetical protein